ncbi:Sec-independent protein translocase subunit TatA/TatB [Schleiferia thermophila]|uniref:Sec-independent protein translocase protein TatA n=1 Tax=Schleiferia thermophila TaxID=884107 RepID=A0A369AA30_9FLAO|nr:twin-arginine translocase TatA/TatE family subunit [Schleiferia thermophila]PMB29870.1 twin-arginine translocase TatA/TatE family subunit [Fischerella thermalis CCMEE 5319]RCX05156.1 sec-independent protein translocase protein TatA [Schleiferia thermophila]GCD79328.1 Sec-independent protein translocase protein TatA [Schleiferia thermophila]
MFLFIGASEIFFILLIVLLFFGADSIPEIARGLGRGIYEIRRATQDIKNEITKSAQEVIEKEEIAEQAETIRKLKDEIEGTISRKR